LFPLWNLETYLAETMLSVELLTKHISWIKDTEDTQGYLNLTNHVA